MVMPLVLADYFVAALHAMTTFSMSYPRKRIYTIRLYFGRYIRNNGGLVIQVTGESIR